MREGIGQPGQRLLTASKKKYVELGRDDKFSLCSCYNVPAMFRNL